MGSDKGEVKMKKRILAFLFAMVMCLSLGACGGTDSDSDKSTEPVDDIGTIEEITVFDAIHNFNTELQNNDFNYFADNAKMIADNDLYWYGIYDDITCYVQPVEFNDDINKDKAYIMAIRHDKDSKNADLAMDYVKTLIKANNQDLSDDEISKLISDAQAKADDGNTAYNGSGITVGVLNTDDKVEYQVARIYK